MTIAEALLSAFSGMGVLCVFLGLFVVIFIDALIFPMLPEVAILLAYTLAGESFAPLPLCVGILATVLLGETSGTSLLYFLARRARLPHFIRKTMNRYVDVFIINDERLILLNRVVPVLPVLGAFIAVRNWNFSKSILYVIVGSLSKYGLLLLFIGWATLFYHSSVSFYVSLTGVVVLISLSLLASWVCRRRARTRDL